MPEDTEQGTAAPIQAPAVIMPWKQDAESSPFLTRGSQLHTWNVAPCQEVE